MSRAETLRAAFAALSHRARPREDCPEAGTLFEAATGSASQGQFEAMVEHTVGCGSCAESWRLARELTADLVQGAAAGWSWSSRLTWMSLAAAVILVAVGLPLVLDRPGKIDVPVWRAQDKPEIASLQPEDRLMPRDQFILRWSEPAAGARYTITVGGERLEPIASRDDLLRPEFQVPAAALATLPDGAKILWRVQARLPDGRVVFSPTFIAQLP